MFNLIIRVKHCILVKHTATSHTSNWPAMTNETVRTLNNAREGQDSGLCERKKNSQTAAHVFSAQSLSHPDFPALFPILCKTITSSYSVLFVDMLSAAKALWFYSAYRVLLGLTWRSGNSNLMKDTKVEVKFNGIKTTLPPNHIVYYYNLRRFSSNRVTMCAVAV